MEELPTPLSRVELYLAKAAGMDVTIPEKPLSRLEQFLAVIAGDTNVEMPIPYSFSEQWLSCVYYGASFVHPPIEGAYRTDNQKVDARYFAVASGVPGATLPPAPQNRKEQYWAVIAQNGPVHGLYKYVTGTSLDLIDVMSDIQELKFVYGDTYQTTYAGKNLYNPNDSWNLNLVTKPTFDEATQTTTVSQNTSTSSGTRYARTIIPVTPGGTYTLSAANITRTESVTYADYVRAREYRDGAISQVGHGISPTSLSNTFTVANNCTALYMYLYVGANETIEGATMTVRELQVNEGAAIAYEPYPSPNPYYSQKIETATGLQTVKITGTGKNLFDKNNPNLRAGYFSANGTISTYNIVDMTSTSDRFVYLECQPNTEYTITKPLQTTQSLNRFRVGTLKNLGAIAGAVLSDYWRMADGGSTTEHTITTGPDAHYLFIYFAKASSATDPGGEIQPLLDGIQVELGETATAYEPYQGQSYEINLGKNLFDGTYENAFIGGSSGNAYLPSANTRSAVIPCLPNTTYTITRGEDTSRFLYGDYPSKPVASDSNTPQLKNRQALSGLSSIITTSSTANYMVVYVSNTSQEPQLQVENGPAPTAYAAYFAPIELCRIGEHQDYIYKNGDDWYLHKAIGKYTMPEGKYFLGISGSSAGPDTQSAAGTFSFLRSDIGNEVYDSFMKNARLCSLAIYSNVSVSGNTGAVNLPNCAFTERSGTNDRIYYRNTSLTGKTGREAGALFANSSWYGFLATPTDTKITDATLIAQLDAIASATLPRPEAHIRITAADSNLPAPLEIGYLGRGD